MDYHWQISEFPELNAAQLYAALRLREQVFILEQACLYPDLDNRDQSAVHLLGWRDGEVVAYLRCLAPGSQHSESVLGRVVVCPLQRHARLGSELVRRGIDHNLSRWPAYNIRIHAQAHLQGFYTELGFVAEGELFDEDGIPHIQMVYPATPSG